MSDIFREIDEELRRDRLEQIWKRYGSWIIGAAVILVAATAAITFWRDYQHKQREAAGVEYASALALAHAGKTAEAIEALGKLGTGASDGHGLLARFEIAALKAQSGDKPGAIAAYQAIAEDGAVGQAYRELATVLAALDGVGEGEPAAIIAKLQPIAAGEGPWRASALEVTALAQLKGGDKAAALETYKRLADDLAAPAALRGRAAEMVQALGAE
jgi:hypothetical protein